MHDPTATVAAIQTAPITRAPMEAQQSARLVAGRGIKGDRYFAGIGAMSRWPGAKRELSLIAQEDLDAASLLANAQIPFEQTWRNILTCGVDLRSVSGFESAMHSSKASDRDSRAATSTSSLGARICGRRSKDRADCAPASSSRATCASAISSPCKPSSSRRSETPLTRLTQEHLHEPQQRRYGSAVQTFVVQVVAQRIVERA